VQLRSPVARAVTGLLLVAALALPAPAHAAGTGGIEVSPYPAIVDGHQVTAFHVKVPSRGSVSVRYSLRNTTAAPVRGHLYAASASPDGHGGWTIGGAGSSTYLDLADQQVTLAAHQTQLASFGVDGPSGKHAAVVIEVKQGSIVTRAATLVYLEHGRTVPLPLLLVGIAVLLLLAAAGALAWQRRRPATLSE
jgi:hypothetical protein